MNLEVFVVTDGDYSDYHIVGIFSSQTLANEHVKIYGGDVNAWRVDDDTIYNGHKGLAEFYVEMNEDGATETDGWDLSFPDEDKKYPDIDFSKNKLSCFVLARNREHANKIVNEIRTQLLAQNEWGKKRKHIGGNK
jgi:hypothetical protein